MEETVVISVDNLGLIIDRAEGRYVPETLYRSALNDLNRAVNGHVEVDGQLPLW
jgi:hypothetical protein